VAAILDVGTRTQTFYRYVHFISTGPQLNVTIVMCCFVVDSTDRVTFNVVEAFSLFVFARFVCVALLLDLYRVPANSILLVVVDILHMLRCLATRPSCILDVGNLDDDLSDNKSV
jgi:hypothetical protein